MNPIRAAIRSVGAAFTAAGSFLTRGGQSISLIPQYLANLLWLLSQDFYRLATDGFKGNAAVYAALGVISRAIAEPGLKAHFVTATGELGDPLPFTHPLTLLIRDPNELMTEMEMWELIGLHLMIIGRSVWYIEENQVGVPIALWPLRPDRVGPIYSLDETPGKRVISGWSYLVPGTVNYVPIPREQTWFMNLPDPAGESGGIVEGVGPLQALASEVGVDNEATKFVGSLMANYGTPGVLLQTKTPINDKDTAKEIKAAFAREFGGNRRGLPALVDADTTVTQLGFNLRDLEFPSARATAESRIAAAVGAPAILIGLKTGLDAGIRATIEEQREYFTETTLSSYWRRLSTSFTRDVARKFEASVVCEFDMREVKALARQGRYETERVQAGFTTGAVTVDEYREKVLRLPPLNNPYGQSFMIPTLAVPTPSESALVVNPNTTGGENPEDVTGDEEQAAARPTPTKAAALTHLRTARLVTTRVNAAAKVHTPLLADYLAGLAQHVAARISEPHRLPTKVATLPPAGDLLPEDEDAELIRLLTALWTEVLQNAYADAAATTGIDLSYDVTNPAIVKILGQIGTRVTQIDDTTRQAIRDLTGRATQEGLTMDQLAAQIQDAGIFSASRAETIARTESGTAYNLGALAAYEDSGAVDAVYVMDGDYDEECAAANGQTWTLDYASRHPLEHPRCTRAFGPIVQSTTADKRLSRSVLRELAVQIARLDRAEPVTSNGRHR